MNARQQYDLFGTMIDLFDGSLPHDEAEQLITRLATDAEAYTLYLQFVRMDVGIEWSFGRRPPQQLVANELAALPAPTGDSGAPNQVHGGQASTSRLPSISLSRDFSRFSRPVLQSAALVALCVYGAFALMAWNLRSGKLPSLTAGHPDPVAVVRDTTEVQWSEGVLSKSAESPVLSGDPFKIESGTMELELNAGTKLVIEGPADWSINGENSVLLRAGKLMARVPGRAIGFTVETPMAKIVDLGTEFGVEVASGETSVHVFKGVVELSQHGSHSKVGDGTSPSTLRLGAGKAVRTTAEGIVSTEFVPDKFIRSTAKSSPPLRTRQTRMIDLRNAIATQSSSQEPLIHPGRFAIDGDYQSASHTAAQDTAPWLQIDLATVRSVAVVVLHSRPGSAGWLRDITVKVLAEDGKTVVATSPKLNPKNAWGGGEENFIEGPDQVAFDWVRTGGGPPMGRYVRIEREPSTIDNSRIKARAVNPGDYWALACKNALSVTEAQVFELASSAAATITWRTATDVNTSAAAAATITWGTATDVNTSTLTDFSTAGTLFDSGTIYPTADLVIGTTPSITFHRRDTSSTNPFGFVRSGITNVVTSGAIGIASQLSGSFPTNDYQRMLSYGTYGGGGRDLTISGLTINKQYQVQIWTPYWNQAGAKTTFTAGNSVTLNVGFVKGGDGPVSIQPQFAIGTFTAIATTHAISWTSTTGDAMFGAIQVRDLTPLLKPSTDDKSATKP
jgi:hypothetical protein